MLKNKSFDIWFEENLDIISEALNVANPDLKKTFEYRLRLVLIYDEIARKHPNVDIGYIEYAINFSAPLTLAQSLPVPPKRKTTDYKRFMSEDGRRADFQMTDLLKNPKTPLRVRAEIMLHFDSRPLLSKEDELLNKWILKYSTDRKTTHNIGLIACLFEEHFREKTGKPLHTITGKLIQTLFPTFRTLQKKGNSVLNNAMCQIIKEKRSLFKDAYPEFCQLYLKKS